MSLADLSDAESGYLVGFLEAEAHFYIVALNGGQSHSCGVAVTARDDDAELIACLQRRTGLGHVRPRAAYRSSHPQVVWTIATQVDTAELAEVLRRMPPIGRKAAICAVWVRAVARWQRRDPDRREAMRDLRDELRTVSAYGASRETRELDLTSPLDRGYATGMVVGDGYFGISPCGARMAVHLRDDDQGLLETFRRAVGGSIAAHGARGTSRPLPRGPFALSPT